MNRLQVSLTQTQYEFLKSEAFVLGKSMAAVLRELLDTVMEARQECALESDPIWQVIGVGHDIDGPSNISSQVDNYLYGPLLSSDENPPNDEHPHQEQFTPNTSQQSVIKSTKTQSESELPQDPEHPQGFEAQLPIESYQIPITESITI